MRCQKISLDKDSEALKALMQKRGISLSFFEHLPELGYLVYAQHADVIIAAGFLRKVEGGFGILDGFITDPEFSSDDRNEALDLLTKTLIEEARKLELKQLFAFSVYPEIINRARRHGFDNTPYAFTILNLTKDGERWDSSPTYQ